MARSPESFRNYFQSVVKLSNGYANHERTLVNAGQKAWDVYGSSLHEYESDFKDVFPYTFTEFLAARKLKRGKVFALDVMGTAEFSEIYPVTGEAAMTLVDFRTDQEKIRDQERNRLVTDGTILLKKPWTKKRNYLEENQTDGFDLITSRSAAGWRAMRRMNETYQNILEWHMVNRMYRLLAPDGGTLLIQMPIQKNMSTWKIMNEEQGLEVQPSLNLLRVTRGIHAPKNLPRIS